MPTLLAPSKMGLDAVSEVMAAKDLFHEAVKALTEQYSDHDLAVIHDYLTRSIETIQVETAKLREDEVSEQ